MPFTTLEPAVPITAQVPEAIRLTTTHQVATGMGHPTRQATHRLQSVPTDLQKMSRMTMKMNFDE